MECTGILNIRTRVLFRDYDFKNPRSFESRLDETGGLQVMIHLSCLVRTVMSVLRWYYLSKSFLRCDAKMVVTEFMLVLYK